MPAKLPNTITITTKSGRIKTKYPILCRNCKLKTFGWRKGTNRFCSAKCAVDFQYLNGRDKYQATVKARQTAKKLNYGFLYHAFGEKHWNWKGGITSENEKIRKSRLYIEWRNSVFERDNYTCVWCGIKGYALNADHIKSFAEYPELRLDLNNGRTLCADCHRKTDTYGNSRKTRLTI